MTNQGLQKSCGRNGRTAGQQGQFSKMQELRKARYAQNNSTSPEHEADNIRSSGAQRSQAAEKKMSARLSLVPRRHTIIKSMGDGLESKSTSYQSDAK
jgi:hypothetical protein